MTMRAVRTTMKLMTTTIRTTVWTMRMTRTESVNEAAPPRSAPAPGNAVLIGARSADPCDRFDSSESSPVSVLFFVSRCRYDVPSLLTTALLRSLLLRSLSARCHLPIFFDCVYYCYCHMLALHLVALLRTKRNMKPKKALQPTSQPPFMMARLFEIRLRVIGRRLRTKDREVLVRRVEDFRPLEFL